MDLFQLCSRQTSGGPRSPPSSLPGTPTSMLSNQHLPLGVHWPAKGEPEGLGYLNARGRLACSFRDQ